MVIGRGAQVQRNVAQPGSRADLREKPRRPLTSTLGIFMLTDPQAWLSDHKGIAIGIPILGGLVSFYPSYLLCVAVAQQFGVDIAAPLMPQPHSTLLLNVFIVIMGAFAICGFFAGAEIVVRMLMRRFSLNWRGAWREFTAESWGKAR